MKTADGSWLSKQEGQQMLDLIKKGLLAGLGAVVVTKERVEKATQKLVEEGKISADEAEKLASELVESGEKQWHEVQAKIEESVKRATENLNLCSRREYEELKSRVEALEKRVTVVEDLTREPE
jgi:polyhydroxyalkanoate synthesis regulator phasin